MANRKGKVCRFTPYIKEKSDDKDKVKLDIEILKSLMYKFKYDIEIRFYFSKIINKLKKL